MAHLRESATGVEPLCVCAKCGYEQPDPNWCHKCGHRVIWPEWAKEFAAHQQRLGAESERERIVEALRERADWLDANGFGSRASDGTLLLDRDWPASFVEEWAAGRTVQNEASTSEGKQ